MFDMSIPTISDEELVKRYASIKPVLEVEGKLHYFREFNLSELKNQSYLWNAKEDIREEVPANELTLFEGRDFLCLHTYGFYSLFKPSIAEVLSQISPADIPFVKAFEIIRRPVEASEFSQNMFYPEAFRNGYHVSTVRLYKATY